MTEHLHRTAWIRMRQAKPILNQHLDALITTVELVFEYVPEEVLTDRKALKELLVEELRHAGEVYMNVLETQWQSAWEKSMAGKFVDMPNIQN